MIEIVHPSASAQTNVAEIASDYEKRFRQEAVLVVRSEVESALV